MYSKALAQTTDYRIETLSSIVKVLAGSWLMALSAQWVIPLQPVPITLQTFMAMLLGVFLGPRQAAYSVLLYLIQIAYGLPVTAGGIANPLALVGPKAGYLIGMVGQAYCVGWYVEHAKKMDFVETFASFCLISLIQLTLGACVLALFIGIKSAFYFGFLPFVAIEMIKCIFAMRVSKSSK